MQNIEGQALATYTRTIPLWLRYVDDTFTALHKDEIDQKKKFSLSAACRLFSRGMIFTRARVSLALLSLRTNGGLLVIYPATYKAVKSSVK